MRFFYFFVVMLGLGGLGCTEPQKPAPAPDRDLTAPSEAAMNGQDKPTEARDAGRPRPSTGTDLNRADTPEAALDAGSEADLSPGDPAMTEDPSAMAKDPPALPEDPPDPQATDPNAVGDAEPTLIGSWFGPAEDLLGRKYTACFIIDQAATPGPAGTVAYAGALDCKYDIEYSGFGDGEFSFKSIVKSGSGCFPSELRLPAPSGDTVHFNMYINGGSVPEGTGTLARVAACP